MRLPRPTWLIVLGTTALASACGSSGSSGAPGVSLPDGGVAQIHETASTNTNEVWITIYDDGSAERIIEGDGGYWVRGMGPALPARSYPAGSELGEQLLDSLDRVGDLWKLTPGPCVKSVSFGTETTVSTRTQTSVDLQCVDSPSDDEQALVDAAKAFLEPDPADAGS
jgi:hypothetical protein